MLLVSSRYILRVIKNIFGYYNHGNTWTIQFELILQKFLHVNMLSLLMIDTRNTSNIFIYIRQAPECFQDSHEQSSHITPW